MGTLCPVARRTAILHRVAHDGGADLVPGTPVAGDPDTRPPEQDGAAGPGYRPGYEVVAEQILKLIAELGLAPGDRMPTENELASRLGTSRTTVREAVKILSA